LPPVLDPLQNIIKDSASVFRKYAVYGLAALSDKRDMELVIMALKADSEHVQMKAASALEKQ
jgi:HEAT repeat protein